MCLTLFDVDGPLIIDRTPEFFAWANSLPEVSDSWNHKCFIETGDWIPATGGLPTEQITLFYQRFLEEPSCPRMQVTPGASKAISILDKLTKHVATARPATLKKTTQNFISEYIGCFTKFHFGVHWEKAELARDCNAQYIIDDNHQLLHKAAALSSVQPILFPTRCKRNLSDLRGVTVLRAESRVTENTSLDSFFIICILAWQEITSILQNGHQP